MGQGLALPWPSGSSAELCRSQSEVFLAFHILMKDICQCRHIEHTLFKLLSSMCKFKIFRHAGSLHLLPGPGSCTVQGRPGWGLAGSGVGRPRTGAGCPGALKPSAQLWGWEEGAGQNQLSRGGPCQQGRQTNLQCVRWGRAAGVDLRRPQSPRRWGCRTGSPQGGGLS